MSRLFCSVSVRQISIWPMSCLGLDRIGLEGIWKLSNGYPQVGDLLNVGVFHLNESRAQGVFGILANDWTSNEAPQPKCPQKKFFWEFVLFLSVSDLQLDIWFGRQRRLPDWQSADYIHGLWCMTCILASCIPSSSDSSSINFLFFSRTCRASEGESDIELQEPGEIISLNGIGFEASEIKSSSIPGALNDVVCVNIAIEQTRPGSQRFLKAIELF